MFKLTIETDNAAFAYDDGSPNAYDEIARILADLATRLPSAGSPISHGSLRDVNGNTVGSWKLTP